MSGGLDQIGHLFVSGAPGVARVIAVATEPRLADPLHAALRMTRRLERGPNERITFITPMPDPDEVPIIYRLLPRGAAPPPITGTSPVRLEANGGLELLLTPGGRRSMSTPPPVPVQHALEGERVLVVHLKGVPAARWTEAERWADALVVLPHNPVESTADVEPADKPGREALLAWAAFLEGYSRGWAGL